jgi:hypothetical protein
MLLRVWNQEQKWVWIFNFVKNDGINKYIILVSLRILVALVRAMSILRSVYLGFS